MRTERDLKREREIALALRAEDGGKKWCPKREPAPRERFKRPNTRQWLKVAEAEAAERAEADRLLKDDGSLEDL